MRSGFQLLAALASPERHGFRAFGLGYNGYIGIMEEKMETTIKGLGGLGFSVQGLGRYLLGFCPWWTLKDTGV